MNIQKYYCLLFSAICFCTLSTAIYTLSEYQKRIIRKIDEMLAYSIKNIASNKLQAKPALQIRSVRLLIEISSVEHKDDFVFLKKVKKILQEFDQKGFPYPDGFPTLNFGPLLEFVCKEQTKILTLCN